MIAKAALIGGLVVKNGRAKYVCSPSPGLGGLSRFP